MPCNYVHAEVGPTEDFVAEECIEDREAQMNYLGNMRMLFLLSEQILNSREYGKDTI